MSAKIVFFPVDNGDMTLVRLADNSSTTLLIDMHIRAAADDPNDSTPDVAKMLRKYLLKDKNNRPYVDAFLLSHPDKDHCTGLQKHFWLGSPDNYPDDKLPLESKRILIREIWSSPMVFRRASKNHVLCSDAKAFNSEARRRVQHWRDNGVADDGNRILVLGEDENGKTDDLTPILLKEGDTITAINGASVSGYFAAKLIAPFSKQDDVEQEDLLVKNNSSVIMNMDIHPSKWSSTPTKFLSGGDAEVAIWEKIWGKYSDTPEVLEYDLLLAPHHCSWHSLSYDSWSKLKNAAKVSESAKAALGQAKNGATIVSSSKRIVDDENDPPCIRAKTEYKSILSPQDGIFLCTGEQKVDEPLELTIESNGSLTKKLIVGTTAVISAVGSTAPRAG